ncbi:hypothetical protein [Actinocrispum sp. NPDC049592]|uniref:hypothetical protein n=1 Tax=Actinocrispum sp. NPDC049592 TaxID=3154835 RepID=UPI00342741A4
MLGGISVIGGVEQLVLAELLDAGGYDRHVRTTRSTYRRRRDELVAMIAGSDGVRLSGIAAGLHALIELPRPPPCAAPARDDWPCSVWTSPASGRAQGP